MVDEPGLYGLQPTYEGLKRKMEFDERSQMRFAAYLRGIETPIPDNVCKLHVPRLQPTYEGLKPRVYVARALASGGLQPTYEGLKP